MEQPSILITINGAAAVSNEFYPFYSGRTILAHLYVLLFHYLLCDRRELINRALYTRRATDSGGGMYVENPWIVPLNAGYGMSGHDLS